MKVEGDIGSAAQPGQHQADDGGERRGEGATRILFDGFVEVGGALGPSFEAQAVDVSEDGMHLRTAYLPEVGQPLTCRFDAASVAVSASAEVVWREEQGRGGEFGIRFTDLDAESSAALAKVVGIVPPAGAPLKGPLNGELGSKVRLHIDGLGSPMRARVKDAKHCELTVGSELGFLQVGKQLELEDAATGGKRPARIDRVDVEIDPTSKVPQLVVTLRYEDEAAEVESPACAPVANPAEPRPMGEPVEAKESTPGPSVIDDEAEGARDSASALADAQASEDLDVIRRAQADMRGAFARGAAKVGPAMMKLLQRARITMALIAARRAQDSEEAIPLRRVTSPAPGGGLHANGRKVVRGDSTSDIKIEAPTKAKTSMSKRRIVAMGVVGAAVVIGVIASRKPAAPTTSAGASQADINGAAQSAPQLPLPTLPAQPPAANANLAPGTFGAPPLAAPPAADIEANAREGTDSHAHHRPMHVLPFGSSGVSHGVVLHLKMDGDIEKIEGAVQPTGFTVVLPNRRSLEAAAPLAARDARIGAIHVTNEASGAELSVTFKDGVPNYQVRAKGDMLEIILATDAAQRSPHADDAPIARHVEPAEATHEAHRSDMPTAFKKKHLKHGDNR